MGKPDDMRWLELKLWAYRILVDERRFIDATDFAKLSASDLTTIQEVLLEMASEHGLEVA